MLTVVVGLAPLPDAAGAERVPAKQVMKRLRDRGKLDLPPHTVVTGDLILPDRASLTARNATFKGTVTTAQLPGIRPLKPPGSLLLRDAHFERQASIVVGSFHTVDCSGCTFDREADFHSLRVRRMLLDHAIFRDVTTFISATFETELRLVDTRFDDSVSFAAARIHGFEAARLQTTKPIVIGWNQFGDEWAARQRALVFAAEDNEERAGRAAQVREEFRFWRRNFQGLDLEDDAREANYALVKLNRREDFVSYKPNSYAPYVLALASGYGTDPYRPFWVAVVAIIGFGVVFALIGFQQQADGTTTPVKRRYWLPFGFAFSVQTFVPFLTIPGIKDSKWELRHLWSLESIEGVIGVLVFGVAAYSAAVNL